MPPGSRQLHTKSRNGCGQCKKRRVRCNLEPPACYNCRRRKETCDYSLGYPTLSTASSSEHTRPPLGPRVSTPLPIDSLSIVAPRRPFSDVILCFLIETDSSTTAIQTQELHRHFEEFSYLVPTVKSIQSLFEWSSGGQMLSDLYASAIQYNMEASSRFRLSDNIKVTETNWLAMLIFGIGVMIFHFCIALTSPDNDFNFLDVFRVLRESARLGRQVGPYFLRSRLGTFLRRQYTLEELSVDDKILSAIQQLDAIAIRETVEDRILTYYQTLDCLRSWVIMVEGRPRTWRDFIYFPEAVPKTYLEYLQRRDPFALLIFTYWCAIMHQAPRRWYMDRWACRAAHSAMSYLGSEWEESLQWPKAVLDSLTPSHVASQIAARDYYWELIFYFLRPDRFD